MKRNRGFTIVELLIVIVVIAILAAISIVAYTGIQNRANDSAVQSNLRQAASQLELFRVNSPSEQFPTTAAQIQSLDIRVTRSAYNATDDLNMTYCSDGTSYALAGRSKSGSMFIARPGGVTTTTSTNAATCGGSGMPRIISFWWLSGEGGWRSWVKS